MTGCGCGKLVAPAKDPSLIVPVDYPAYDEEVAQSFVKEYPDVPADLAIRCYTSQLIGKEPSLVLHGGGNTSCKLTVKNKVGDDVDVLCVKGSGYNLDSIIPKGFPQVDLNHLKRMLTLDSLSDPEMVNELRTHMMDASSPNPSVETLLHALIPAKFVDHSHADAIVAMADHNLEAAQAIFKEAFGDQLSFAIVPYHMPGFELAGAARDVFSSAGDVDCLILLKHGLFTWGEDARSSYEKHIKAVSLAEKYIQSKQAPKLTLRPYTEPSPAFFDRVTNILRGVFHHMSNGQHWIVSYRESDVATAWAQSEECEELFLGPVTPDHVIRTKRKPCLIRGLVESKFFKDEEALSMDMVQETPSGNGALREYIMSCLQNYVDEYNTYFEEHNLRVGGIKQALDPLPRVLLLENFGLFTVDKDPKACSISADIYVRTIPTVLSSVATSPENKYEPVTSAEAFDCEYWDLEQNKLKLGGKKPDALAGRVAFITGAGSGIGLATAELFAKQGACVYIADIDQTRVNDAVSQIAKATKNKFLVAGGIVNVADRAAIEDAMHEVCMMWGGVDLVVSNAGIVVQSAPGIASVDPAQLELSLNINFLGHQWVSSSAVRRMVVQQTGGCLLYNVSKAPLNPGPKLGPYCVAKAGALALMRQYAVEYGDRKIRSNAVNADRVRTNLFDLDLVAKRAQARGLSADEYFRSNLLGEEVLSMDVAKAFLDLALSEKTTGCITTVDGGNIAAAPR